MVLDFNVATNAIQTSIYRLFRSSFLSSINRILLFLLFIFPKKWLVKGDIKRSWLLVVIFVFLCSFTFIKSRSYSDPMTFYNSAISQNSNSALAYNNRGIIKDEQK